MTSEGLQEFLRSRRSVRRFQDTPVPVDVLERILVTATWAPSAHNRQPWRFVVLESVEAKFRLAKEMGLEFQRDLKRDGLPLEEVDAQIDRSFRRIVEAPLVIALCMDLSDMDVYPDPERCEAERLIAVQSVAMAGSSLMLASHAEGLGTVWMCAPLFAPGPVRKALDLPSEWEPQGLILFGYPAKVPEPRPRRSLSEIARFL